MASAEAMGIELVDVVRDAGYSAGTMKRPGLARVLAMLDRGEAGGVLVVSLSRLTRSTKDLGYLLERHFGPESSTLVSLGENIDTTSASGRLVANVLGAVLAWEREAAGERTAEVKAHERTKGRFLGGRWTPYGWGKLDDGSLVELEEEQEVIRFARLGRDGGDSLRAIADDLTSRGRLARNGKPFAAVQIARMLSGAVATLEATSS